MPILSACSREPADPVASARQLSGAPAWVRTPTGIDCGEAELDSRRTLPEKNLECLADARRAGDAAFLTWIARTTEGDPIPTFARATRSGVDVASTTAYDSFGPGGWSESTCANVAALPSCADI
ncbi:hypothetical protein EDF46_2378 [Frondihabitans sp. PhB188]|nr:hypothetical protein EDF46_2378 [Frondihabitans sp. PhB188]